MSLNNQRNPVYKRLRNNGFTLIEVLVAVFVLAVGTLGAASLQIITKRSNFEASQRTQATQLANATVDRMRGNPEALACYASSNLGDGLSPSACGDSVADADRTALDKLADASSTLVNPRLCINNALGTVSVTVAWRGISQATTPPVAGSCGLASIGAEYYKQVRIDTYIDPHNPFK